ncbi:MAG: hypothetical protein ACC613_03685 [Synergistales bacterium]
MFRFAQREPVRNVRTLSEDLLFHFQKVHDDLVDPGTVEFLQFGVSLIDGVAPFVVGSA